MKKILKFLGAVMLALIEARQLQVDMYLRNRHWPKES